MVAVGPLLTSALAPLAVEFDVPLQKFVLGLQGSCIAAIAVSSILCNTLAVKVGKRPIYIATSIGLMVSCFWAAASQSFASLAAARAVQGFCMAPMEALVPATIADIWFVHERGLQSAVFNLGVLGGINLVSPIGQCISRFCCVRIPPSRVANIWLAGAVIEYGSYRTCLWAMGGAFAVQVLMTVLFMPESAYHRSGAINIDSSDMYASQTFEKKFDVEHDEQTSASPMRQSSIEPKKSLARELLPYDGYWDKTSFWRTLIRPFFFLGSPMVVWATLLFTTCISWLVLISITLSQIFSAPPYNFSIVAVGVTNLSSFVASLLATLAAGPLIDGLAKFMAKKNKGTFGKCYLPPARLA